MVIVAQKTTGELDDPQQWLVFPTVLNGKSYLNLARASQEQIDRVRKEGWTLSLVEIYILAKYEVKDGSLIAWPTDEKAKRKAIESGAIQGEIRTTDKTEPIYFEDTIENLAAFVADADDHLFRTEPVRLERVR